MTQRLSLPEPFIGGPLTSPVDDIRELQERFEAIQRNFEAIAIGVIADAANLADGSVTAAKLASGAVIEIKIGTGAVTRSKLSGVQTKRVSTGSVAGLAIATVTVTWNSAFADTNYTPVVSVEETANAGEVAFTHEISAKSATAIDVTLTNTTAGARTGTINAFAIAD